jgi:Transposase and inactivated derivatives
MTLITESTGSMSDLKTVRPLTEQEHQALEAMTREAVGRVAMRAQMVLLSARGYSAPTIAEIQDIAKATVYKWIDRFDEEGPSGLYDQDREGRPRKLGSDAEAELERVLEEPPTEEGYNASRWTAPRLARHLEHELGTEVHPDTVRRALQRLEYSWKRPRRVLPKPPGWEERLAQIERRIEETGPETTVLFEDETELRRFPPLRRAWMPVGEQRPVPVPDQNGKFFLYGALDIGSGEVITEAHPKGKTCYMEAFLETVLAEISGPILLVWDRASWHVSGAIQDLIEAHGRLEVLLLPSRTPEANPVEDLWRLLKNRVAANLEQSLEALEAACERFFEQLSPDEALQKAGFSTS